MCIALYLPPMPCILDRHLTIHSHLMVGYCLICQVLHGLSSTGLQVLAGHSGPVTCGVFSSDGSSLITGGGADDCSLRIWSIGSGECTAVVSGHLFHAAGKLVTCCVYTAPEQLLLHVVRGPCQADHASRPCHLDLLALVLFSS